MNIAAFPKCYIDDIAVNRTMSLFDWIKMARSLPCEGLELYEGFLWQRDNAYLDGEADGPRSYAATAWAVRGIEP